MRGAAPRRGESPAGDAAVVCAARLYSRDAEPASAIVAFLEIAQAPRLLASLASKIPPDIVPMPLERLSAYCQRPGAVPVALNGVVVCVPHEALAPEDRAIVEDLARLIPVLRIHDDPRGEGRGFFDRCREAQPRVPRAADRVVYRQPVTVTRADRPDPGRLLVAENVSPGGMFLKDPCLSCDPHEILRLRFPGLTDVPELTGRVRWVRPHRERGQPPGYGCVFDSPLEGAVRRLLAGVQAVREPAPFDFQRRRAHVRSR